MQTWKDASHLKGISLYKRKLNRTFAELPLGYAKEDLPEVFVIITQDHRFVYTELYLMISFILHSSFLAYIKAIQV